jgi:hypothetical protein
MKEKFNEEMDKELLENGFAYYDDWKYGPMSGWTTSHEHHTLRLMRHDFGYDLIISRHASGTNPTMGIGSSNNAKDIIKIRDSLKNLW